MYLEELHDVADGFGLRLDRNHEEWVFLLSLL